MPIYWTGRSLQRIKRHERVLQRHGRPTQAERQPSGLSNPSLDQQPRHIDGHLSAFGFTVTPPTHQAK